MHLTRGDGGINQGETAHPLWSLWIGQFRRQCQYLGWALSMRGKSLEGEALKLNHPTVDSEKGEKGA